MIRHIVLVRFQPNVSESAISDIFAELEAVRAEITGMGPVVSGKSTSPEQIERGYMHGFSVDFESWDGLRSYQNNPSHKKSGAKIVAAAQGGIEGVLVFDLEFQA